MRVRVVIEDEMGTEVDVCIEREAHDLGIPDPQIGVDPMVRQKAIRDHLAGLFLDVSARAVKAAGIESYLEVNRSGE